MKSKAASILKYSIAAGILSHQAAHAALVIGTTNQNAGISPNPALFTPTFVISPINNVLAGLTPSASIGNFAMENSGGIPILTNGVFGPMSNDGTPTSTHPSLATFGNGGGAGSSITYSFAATSLVSIFIYGGWNDQGRDNQSYTVQYSTNGGTTYLDLGSVNYNPTGTVGQSANQVSFTDNAGNLAGGVAITNLRINAGTTENGYAGLAEIVAYAAVPEPSGALLGAVGALGLLRRRRA